MIIGGNRDGCTGTGKFWVKNKSWVMEKWGRKRDLGCRLNRTS